MSSTFTAGAIIFAQGEVADCAYLLESGRVSVTQRFDGSTLELESIVPGEMFGEMALLSGGRHMVTATAAEDSVVISIPVASYEADLEAAGRSIRAVIATFVKNIRCSHRIFLRRPRSLRDHLRQMSIFTDNIRRFAGRVEDVEVAAQMAESLGRIERDLARIGTLAAQARDPRHDMIAEEDGLYGVSFRDVAASATCRRVVANEEAPR